MTAAGESRDPGQPGAVPVGGGTAAAFLREPELAGQTVAVIGGSSGIGLETARRAIAEGADAILIGRNRGPGPGAGPRRSLGVQRTAAFDATDEDGRGRGSSATCRR